MRIARGAQRLVGYLSLLCFLDADWLTRQTPIAWSVFTSQSLSSELLEHSHLNSELLGSIKHRHLPFLLFVRLLYFKVRCSSDVLFCFLFFCFVLFLFVCLFFVFRVVFRVVDLDLLLTWTCWCCWQVNNKCEEMTRTDLGNKVMEVSHSRGTDRWLVVKKELDASKVNVIHYFLPHHRSQRIQQ